jgi:hypothetical protein
MGRSVITSFQATENTSRTRPATSSTQPFAPAMASFQATFLHTLRERPERRAKAKIRKLQAAACVPSEAMNTPGHDPPPRSISRDVNPLSVSSQWPASDDLCPASCGPMCQTTAPRLLEQIALHIQMFWNAGISSHSSPQAMQLHTIQPISVLPVTALRPSHTMNPSTDGDSADG